MSRHSGNATFEGQPVHIVYGWDGPINDCFIQVWKNNDRDDNEPLWDSTFSDPSWRPGKYNQAELVVNYAEISGVVFQDRAKIIAEIDDDRVNWVDQRSPAMKSFHEAIGRDFEPPKEEETVKTIDIGTLAIAHEDVPPEWGEITAEQTCKDCPKFDPCPIPDLAIYSIQIVAEQLHISRVEAIRRWEAGAIELPFSAQPPLVNYVKRSLFIAQGEAETQVKEVLQSDQ